DEAEAESGPGLGVGGNAGWVIVRGPRHEAGTEGLEVPAPSAPLVFRRPRAPDPSPVPVATHRHYQTSSALGPRLLRGGPMPWAYLKPSSAIPWRGAFQPCVRQGSRGHPHDEKGGIVSRGIPVGPHEVFIQRLSHPSRLLPGMLGEHGDQLGLSPAGAPVTLVQKSV